MYRVTCLFCLHACVNCSLTRPHACMLHVCQACSQPLNKGDSIYHKLKLIVGVVNYIYTHCLLLSTNLPENSVVGMLKSNLLLKCRETLELKAIISSYLQI